MSRIAFIYRTDVHASDKNPASWKGDYLAEIWSSLEEIGQIAKAHKVAAVLDGGDYFHIKTASRNSHSLVIRTTKIHSEYSCPVYCVEGNHDLFYNNLDSIDQQPLGVLYATKVFQHLREEVFREGALQVRVVGVPYSLTRSLEDLLAIQKQPGDNFLVAVVHSLATEAPPSKVEGFFKEPVFRYGDLVTENGPDVFCFPSGTPVLDSLYRPLPIEGVKKDFSMLGRDGSTIVEEVHPVRFVNTDLVRVEVEGVPSLTGVTVEHPYWVAKGLHCSLSSRNTRRCHPDKVMTSYPCSVCIKAPSVSSSWVEAGKIEIGDYIAIPVPKIPSGAPSSPGLARLLGYYVAEGHLIKNRQKEPIAGVGWSFNSNETSLHKDVSSLVKEYFDIDTHIHISKVSNSVQVCGYGQAISEFFLQHGGRYAAKKSLSSWIWQRSAMDRFEFLIGWLLGDGYVRPVKTKARLRAEIVGATVSKTLSFQIFFLALSIGLHPYFTVRPARVTHFNRYKDRHSTSVCLPVNVISFYGDDANLLSKCMGISPSDRGKTKVAAFFERDLYYARVKKVSRFRYTGNVHNFRTSTGEYVAGGLLVHNCFGHWHKDQGIVNIGGKYFVNQGAVSRGALTHDNLDRVPQVALLEFNTSGINVKTLSLTVAPSEDVFDLEKKERVENEKRSIDHFLERLQEDAVFSSTATVETNIQSLGFASEVRDLALAYLERAREEV